MLTTPPPHSIKMSTADFRSRELWAPVAEEEAQAAAAEGRDTRQTVGSFLLGTGLLSLAFSRRQKVKTAVKASFNLDIWRAMFILTGTGLLVSTLDSVSLSSDVPEKSHSSRKGKAVAKFSFEMYNVDNAPEVTALKSVSTGQSVLNAILDRDRGLDDHATRLIFNRSKNVTH